MEPKKIFLQLRDSIVIAYHSTDIPEKYLAENEKTVDILTATPWLYIGLTEEQITEDPLPTQPPLVDVESLEYAETRFKGAYELYKNLVFLRETDSQTQYLDLIAKAETYFIKKLGQDFYSGTFRMFQNSLFSLRLENMLFSFGQEEFPLDSGSRELYNSLAMKPQTVTIRTSKNGSFSFESTAQVEEFIDNYNDFIISTLSNWQNE